MINNNNNSNNNNDTSNNNNNMTNINNPLINNNAYAGSHVSANGSTSPPTYVESQGGLTCKRLKIVIFPNC